MTTVRKLTSVNGSVDISAVSDALPSLSPTCLRSVCLITSTDDLHKTKTTTLILLSSIVLSGGQVWIGYSFGINRVISEKWVVWETGNNTAS